MLFAALIPLVLQFAPEIIGLFTGPAVGTALNHIGEAAQQVFATTDAEQIKLAIQQDASKAEAFKQAVMERTETVRMQMADLQSAREQTVGLAQAGSLIAWGAPIVSALITFGFFGVLVLYLNRPIGADNQVVTMLVGTMATAFGAVVQYWLGSSQGSKNKDVLMAHLSTASTTNAVGAIRDTAAKMFK